MADGPSILLLGDYSSCHRTLARGLRNIGCDVTVVSDGTEWQNSERDFDISRPKGKLGGLKVWLRTMGPLHRHLKGYDIVAIHEPNILRMRPAPNKVLFDRIRRENGRVFLTAMSTDVPFLDMLQAQDSPLRYSEWFIDGKPNRLYNGIGENWKSWHNKAIVDYHKYFYDHLDGAVAVLYEYWHGVRRALGDDRVAYGGIPVDTDALQPVAIPEEIEKVRFFLGRDRNRVLQKGSDYLEKAARRVVEMHPDKAEFVLFENRPYAEFVQSLKHAHVVLDQIYSYTPATTALMAMAYGLNTVSGAEPDYYNFIGEHGNRPIINAPLTLDALTEELERMAQNPRAIAPRGIASREFVVKHNNMETVARRFLDFWMSKL